MVLNGTMRRRTRINDTHQIDLTKVTHVIAGDMGTEMPNTLIMGELRIQRDRIISINPSQCRMKERTLVSRLNKNNRLAQGSTIPSLPLLSTQNPLQPTRQIKVLQHKVRSMMRRQFHQEIHQSKFVTLPILTPDIPLHNSHTHSTQSLAMRM